jgi:hypothetical protein
MSLIKNYENYFSLVQSFLLEIILKCLWGHKEDSLLLIVEFAVFWFLTPSQLNAFILRDTIYLLQGIYLLCNKWSGWCKEEDLTIWKPQIVVQDNIGCYEGLT